MEAVQENMELVEDSHLVGEIISKGMKQFSPILYILHELQDNIGYISEDTISKISESLKVPMPEVLSFITFHRQFKLRMSGEAEITARNVIRVCSGAPCHTKGSSRLVDKLTELLGIQQGEITKDKKFSLEVVDCMGACGISPVMMINDDIYGNVTYDQLQTHLDKHE